MKPRIWKKGGWWFCSYYPKSSCEDFSRAKTPLLAWYYWKYKKVSDV